MIPDPLAPAPTAPLRTHARRAQVCRPAGPTRSPAAGRYKRRLSAVTPVRMQARPGPARPRPPGRGRCGGRPRRTNSRLERSSLSQAPAPDSDGAAAAGRSRVLERGSAAKLRCNVAATPSRSPSRSRTSDGACGDSLGRRRPLCIHSRTNARARPHAPHTRTHAPPRARELAHLVAQATCVSPSPRPRLDPSFSASDPATRWGAAYTQGRTSAIAHAQHTRTLAHSDPNAIPPPLNPSNPLSLSQSLRPSLGSPSEKSPYPYLPDPIYPSPSFSSCLVLLQLPPFPSLVLPSPSPPRPLERMQDRPGPAGRTCGGCSASRPRPMRRAAGGGS